MYKDYYEQEKEKRQKRQSNIIKAGCAAVAGVVVLACLLGSWTIIDTGERGVVLRLGRYAETMSEGLNFKTPMIDRVIKLNIRDVNLTVDTEVSSGDMQTIKVKTSLIYALDAKSVGTIYQKYNVNYENILIKPLLLESINSVVANYPIESFVEKRAEISERIKDTFVAKAGHDGIIVKSLMITEHDFSDEFNRAIENKKIAEQGALKAKYDLERVTLEAKAQMEKQKSLNAMVLQEKAIDKWDGKLPQYFSGGELPFIVKQ